MGNFRYLLFAAVAFSLGVYAYRGYRRWIAPPKQTDLPGLDGSSATSSPTDTQARPKPKRGLGFTSPTLPDYDSEGSDGESLVQAVIREELAKKHGAGAASGGSPSAAAAGSSGRSGLFAGSDDGAGRVSVSAALTGVRLPDDLVPLMGDTAQIDPHHVTFVSSSTPAADLGRHLGDELERLGYRVGSESDVVAVATKGDVTLRVTLHPDAGNERLDGAKRFPTAPANSVVVEFTT